MTKLDFSTINKSAAQSFIKQRNLIKRIGQGELVLCEQCSLPLSLNVSELTETGIRCKKGCTDISLEL